MTVVVVGRDLMTATRLEEATRRAGMTLVRVDDPDQLPAVDAVRLVLVDWGDRDPTWARAINDWRSAAGPDGGPRIILFGPHADLDAHATARAAGLGPMKARSALFAQLPELLSR